VNGMKSIGRKLSALLFALLLVVQLCPVPANTVLSGVYMISVDDDLMPPAQETMPFWSGGRLYVPSTVFQGIYRESLDVACAISFNRKTAVLFNAGGALTFDLETGIVQDNRGNQYYISAVERNGTIFFPLDLATEFFGLTYSYLHTNVVPLIRIKSPSVGLSDVRFVDAAHKLMQQYYNEYEKLVTPVQPPPVIEPDDPVVYTGQWVFLVFTVTDAESTRSLANILKRRDMQATFLLRPEQMEEEDELLRALAGMGHGIGILAEEENGEELAQSLEQANDLIWKAARCRTRMVWMGDGAGGFGEAAEQNGYCRMSCLLDYSSKPLTGVSRAKNLYTKLSGMDSQNLTVFLGNDHENTVGLNYFLNDLAAGDCRVLAWRETL